MASKYFSKYSGEDFDRAIEYALQMENEGVYQILESGVSNPINLNELTQPGFYSMSYYIGSYDDTRSGETIFVNVFTIGTDRDAGQIYKYNGRDYIRTYDASTTNWTLWEESETGLEYKIIDTEEELHVNKSTLVFRKAEPSED